MNSIGGSFRSQLYIANYNYNDININEGERKRAIIYIYTRKCYSIEASEGEFYIGGFVLLKLIYFSATVMRRIFEGSAYSRAAINSVGRAIFVPSIQWNLF